MVEEHVACCYHHWTPGGGTDPFWLRFLASGTITKLGPGPNYRLDPTLNDAEILHGVIEKTCNLLVPSLDPRGRQDPVRLRFLAPETITKLGPGPNYSFDSPFNDTEMLSRVKEEV